MKCLKLILLISYIILISSSTSHLNRKDDKNLNQNNYYKWAEGIVEQLGGDKKDIESCLPGEWKVSPKATDDQKSLPSFESDPTKEIFGLIEKNLVVSLDIACKFLPNVKDFFKKKAGVRRFKKVFAQLKKIKSHDTNPFDPLSEKTKETYNVFKEIETCPLVKKTNTFLGCMKTGSGAIPGLINSINNFEKHRQPMIDSLAGFIDVYIPMICRWKEFKDALIFHKNAIESTDTLSKWHNLGCFWGKLIHNAGTD